MSDGIDPKNRLNELTNREWLIETKSFWRSMAEERLCAWPDADSIERFGVWLAKEIGEEGAAEALGQLKSSVLESIAPPRDGLKATHPATFSERDIGRLIEFFTRSGERVLDPFVGAGSTLLACQQTDRVGIGVELIARWAEVTRQRLEAIGAPCRVARPGEALKAAALGAQVLIHADAREALAELPDECFDFVVTSPPYWRILRKDWDHKVKAERLAKGLSTRYSDSDADLGNVESYEKFLQTLGGVFAECRRVVKPKRYVCIVVSDFRHGSKFVSYHADISRVVESIGLTLEGITILVQDNKNLYPYGMPYAYVSNIHHQYVLAFRRNGGAR